MAAAPFRPQRLLPNLLLSLLSVGVFGGAIEVASRWLEKRTPPAPQDGAAQDGALPQWTEGWGAEFYTLSSDPIGFPPRRRFNNEGLRDRSRPTSRVPGSRRIACLGDSVTFGHGVNPASAWPQVLEARLRSGGREVDVLNVALPAWSTRQEKVAYERIVRRYHPDQVLVGVCLNDIPELTANLTPPSPLLSWLYRRSAAFRLAADPPGLEQRSVRELFARSDSRKVRQSFDRFFAEVAELQREVQADGASFALVLFPFRFQLEPGAPPPIVQERIQSHCAAARLACLDLLPAFRELGPSAFIDHDHLTPAGGDLAARRVLESGLAEAGPSAREVLDGWSPSGQEPEPARLIAATRAGDAGVRAAAAWALGTRIRQSGRSAGPEVPALVAALRDPEERVRLASTRALGAAGEDAAAVAALFRVLADPSESVRWAAAEALWDAGAARAVHVGALVQALDVPDLQVRAFAVWCLGRIGPEAGSAAVPLAGLLTEADPPLRARVAQALGGIGPRAADSVPALAAALADRSESVRREAARALGRIGPAARPAVDALTRARRDGDEAVRQEAERALARIRSS